MSYVVRECARRPFHTNGHDRGAGIREATAEEKFPRLFWCCVIRLPLHVYGPYLVTWTLSDVVVRTRLCDLTTCVAPAHVPVLFALCFLHSSSITSLLCEAAQRSIKGKKNLRGRIYIHFPEQYAFATCCCYALSLCVNGNENELFKHLHHMKQPQLVVAAQRSYHFFSAPARPSLIFHGTTKRSTRSLASQRTCCRRG